MNLLNSSKSLSVVATAIGVLTVLSSISPAAAVILKEIKFCGTFDGVSGGVEQGSFIRINLTDDGNVDTEAENFGLQEAQISTTREGEETLTYTESELFDSDMGTEIPGVGSPFDGGDSFFWRFQDQMNGIFNLVINKSSFPLVGSGSFDTRDISEQRFDPEMQTFGPPIKDIDKGDFSTVPEPLTILGSGVALGFGAMFKKEHSRRKKTKTKA